jgi:hypothetical protein
MNRYLVKIAALNPVAKMFAKKVLSGVAGDPSKINKVYGATSGVISKNLGGVLSNAEKTSVVSKMKVQADKIVGPGKLYPMEATRAARAGARLARMQAKKVA